MIASRSDLAWLRSTPWRERVASTFDPDQWRPELHDIRSVEVRHQPESVLSALLFLGWLCSRLGWEPGSLASGGSAMEGITRGPRRDVALRLEPDPTMPAPGLAGVTVESASGMRLSLDRGPGGLTARRRDRGGRESTWTVMGASRGEPGILGEGIRQALPRDRAHRRRRRRRGPGRLGGARERVAGVALAALVVVKLAVLRRLGAIFPSVSLAGVGHPRRVTKCAVCGNLARFSP